MQHLLFQTYNSKHFGEKGKLYILRFAGGIERVFFGNIVMVFEKNGEPQIC